jgi:hypothetical protein
VPHQLIDRTHKGSSVRTPIPPSPGPASQALPRTFPCFSAAPSLHSDDSPSHRDGRRSPSARSCTPCPETRSATRALRGVRYGIPGFGNPL